MTYQVLARKWRPRSFAELAGQSHVVRALTHALSQNRLHHAWLFTGTRGVGKTTIARIMAKSLNCETGISAEPCGVCSACQLIDAGRFVDLIELDAASNTGIDHMREVLDNAQYAPTSGRFKVYIIDEVHMLSKAAFNSMLKTLEEPPEHVKFILATTDPQKIPVTVLSRCLQFNLKQMPPDLVSSHLQHILAEEHIIAEPAAIVRIAHAAQGSMRDALSLLDQAIAFGGGLVNDAAVQHMLGGLDRAALIGLLNALADQDGTTLLALSTQLSTQSIDFNTALQEMAAILHQIALYQAAPEALIDTSNERAALIVLAERLDAETVQLYYQICLLGRRDLSLAPDESSGFNMTLLRMLAFFPGTSAQLTHTANSTAPPSLTPLPTTSAQPASFSAEPDSTAVTECPIKPTPATPHFSQDLKLPHDAQAWSALVNGLKLGGQARMLATECELLHADALSIHLKLSKNNKHLADLSYQTKLRDALNRHFNCVLKLEIELADDTVQSPQRQLTDTRAVQQTMAEQTALNDPFVQDALSQMDGKVTSIQPTTH